MSEKRGVPLPVSTAPEPRSWRQSRLLWPLLVSLLAYNALTTLPSALSAASSLAGAALERAQDVYDDLRYADTFDWDSFDAQVRCPEQPKALYAPIVWNMTQGDKARSADLYSQAVVSGPQTRMCFTDRRQQIPTQSFDDNGEPNEDPRWKPFFDFQKWLKDTFPLA